MDSSRPCQTQSLLRKAQQKCGPPAGAVARGDRGVEVAMEREQPFRGGHRISLNGPDLEPVSQLRDQVINRGMSVAVSPTRLSVERECLPPSSCRR